MHLSKRREVTESSRDCRKCAQSGLVQIARTHMTDKHRHRYLTAPRGVVSNRMLVLFGACAIALVTLAQSFV